MKVNELAIVINDGQLVHNSEYRITRIYKILIFHRLTKEKLHEYGPFSDMSEVTNFATEHDIKLTLHSIASQESK